MSYANMDGVPTQTAGTSELLASDWNTYVRDNFDSIKFGHVVVADATARTNLGNVAEGVMVYQADNQKLYVNRNGTTADWVEISDLDNTGAVSDDAADYLDQYAVQSRNVIINGAMTVAQRATSKTSVAGGGSYDTADRWRAGGSGSDARFTQSIENDAPTGSGLRKSLKMLVTTADATLAAGDNLPFGQLIEGQNIQHFAKGTSSAKKFALQFWVKSNVTGTYIVRLLDNDNSRHVAASYTVNASGTWEKKTVVFPADTTGAFDNDNNTSLNLQFYLFAGSNYTSGTLATSWASSTNADIAVGQVNLGATLNNYWQITGVQLEAGDVNTPFEFEPFETTLRKCQRYYEKSFAIDQDPTDNPTNKRGALHTEVEVTKSYALFPSVVFRVEKRGTPTMTFFNPQTTTAGQACNVNSPYSAVPVTTSIGAASNSETTSGFSIGVNNSSVTGGNQLMVHWVASAEL